MGAGLKDLAAVDLILTSRCNLACSYCYQNRRRGSSMDAETLLAAVDLLLSSERSPIWLSFYGGEPLIRFDMIRRAIAEVETSERRNDRVRYALSTNGLLLGDDEVEYLIRHRVRTQLSFDGVAAQESRAKGTFQLLDGRLEQIRRRHPVFWRWYLSIGMSVDPLTVEMLPESAAYFLGRGIRELGIAPIETSAHSWDRDRIASLDDAMSAVCEMALEHRRATGKVPIRLFRGRPSNCGSGSSNRSLCGVARGESLTVDVDGSVYGCVMFAQSYQRLPGPLLREQLGPMRLGGLGVGGMVEQVERYRDAAGRAEILHHKEDKYSGYGRCGDCEYLSVCSICPVAIGHIPANSDPCRIPDFACAFQKVVGKYRAIFHERSMQ